MSVRTLENLANLVLRKDEARPSIIEWHLNTSFQARRRTTEHFKSHEMLIHAVTATHEHFTDRLKVIYDRLFPQSSESTQPFEQPIQASASPEDDLINRFGGLALEVSSEESSTQQTSHD